MVVERNICVFCLNIDLFVVRFLIWRFSLRGLVLVFSVGFIGVVVICLLKIVGIGGCDELGF